jgi:hypothetical protein
LDEIYRGCRISIRPMDVNWTAWIWTTRGVVLPLTARASRDEGSATCLTRAQSAIDRYLDYIGPPSSWGLL